MFVRHRVDRPRATEGVSAIEKHLDGTELDPFVASPRVPAVSLELSNILLHHLEVFCTKAWLHGHARQFAAELALQILVQTQRVLIGCGDVQARHPQMPHIDEEVFVAKKLVACGELGIGRQRRREVFDGIAHRVPQHARRLAVCVLLDLSIPSDGLRSVLRDPEHPQCQRVRHHEL